MVYFLHGDQLGSASLATTVTGTLLSQRRYLPYGETRWSSGPFPTDRRFTGQREEVTLGVYDYGARFYSPGLGRFLSADTLVPEAGRPQSLNRYSYVLGNPLRYTDPTGYFTQDEIIDFLHANSWDEVLSFFEKGGRWEGRWGWLETLKTASMHDGIEVLDKMPTLGEARPPFVLFSGYWIEMKDQLYIQPTATDKYGNLVENGSPILAETIATLGEAYRTIGHNTRGYGNSVIDAQGENTLYFDKTRVNWQDVGLDTLSTIASVAGANEAVQSLKYSPKVANIATNLSRGITIYQIGKGLVVDQNPNSLILGGGSFLPGPVGGGFSLASVYFDLKNGFYYPYR